MVSGVGGGSEGCFGAGLCYVIVGRTERRPYTKETREQVESRIGVSGRSRAWLVSVRVNCLCLMEGIEDEAAGRSGAHVMATSKGRKGKEHPKGRKELAEGI
jgi:triosephosphate isomerase